MNRHKLKYIKASAVRALVKKDYGKRVSHDFLVVLDNYMCNRVRVAAEEHNGGRKTLSADMGGYVCGFRNNIGK